MRRRRGGTRLATGVTALVIAACLAPASAGAHVLSYAAARAAAQTFANSYAGEATNINRIFRLSPHTWYIQADWDAVDPAGCPDCGKDPSGENGGFYNTPLVRYHAIVIHATCLGAHSAAAALRPCRPRAYVTDVLAPLPTT